ncbi:glutaminyl-peptide cyclotransferase [Allomuricauda sp. SCSIO 65647]|uniref:glutaminyl-peptide cyclotransferase n=1 Tax=Allomuricauda sp. SCSIO 65647 TaxID=2908843 RepID=UPI001F3D5234|nr:glutaminyl-peptide cyclotransferase [Muricauda sp. SCSIO 65647]UJH67564.1 glutaminyl-peptide cyclotransferase [Muricauda sp. SCSIO 65647]
MLKILHSSIILLFFLACGGEKDPAKLFDIQLEGNKKKFQKNQTVAVVLKNKKDLPVEKVEYSIDGKTLALHDDKITFDIEKLGNKQLMANVSYEDRSVIISKKIKVLAETGPEVYTYEIINTYAHDPLAYTQGLEFKGDTLFEGTGKKGSSTLRKLDYKTGKILQQVDLDESVFGEGITILNDKLYQLTWQSGIGYIYNVNTLQRQATFNYGKSKVGWGLCNDGNQLYKSDGTEKIWLLDPDTLQEESYIETVTNKSIFNKANELEYVDGKIYANVYQKESMMIIDARSGAIEGVVNFGGLKSKVTRGKGWDDLNSVLNGVAYHKERGTFFVTGKNWDKLFEVKIVKK